MRTILNVRLRIASRPALPLIDYRNEGKPSPRCGDMTIIPAKVQAWRWTPLAPLEFFAQPYPRAQKFLRVDGFAFGAGLVMQMRPGRAAGRAEPPDGLSDAHALTDGDVDLRQMS